MHKISGNWNSTVTLSDAKGNSQIVWQRTPFPEKVDWMYGMSKFALQANYFPKRLHNIVAPTDTRRRPDQRALENGNIPLAISEKERLENKQRAMRKYLEAAGN